MCWYGNSIGSYTCDCNYGYVWDVNTCIGKEIILVATHVIVTMGMYGMLIHVLVRKEYW
jgi:hypothetical protein